MRNRALTFSLLFIASSFLALIGLFSPSITVRSAFSFDQRLQGSLPQHGWTICADLGLGTVPGVPGSLQRVRICQGAGWEVNAYCLEPARPAPPMGTLCSMVNATDFWCGDANQLTRLYQIQQTPPPAPTQTSTPTPTAPPQLPTSTPTPSQPGVQPSPTPTAPQPTPFSRPAPGGPGNLGLIVSAAAASTGLFVVVLAFLRLKKNP